MAKTKISEYDATAANNTDIDSISIAEGMLPSNVNNALRELMAHLKDMDAGTQALTSPQLTSVDINGGTIDGAVIGGNSAAAISGTTLALSGNADLNGDLDVDGTTNLDVVDIDGAVDMASTLQVDGVLTTTAQAVLNGGFAAVQESTVLIADGQADNAYAFQIKNEESTDDRSYGLLIHAGSTGTDRALAINTHDGAAALFYVQGNGQALFTDGSASFPSITNIGDTNTGIFFPAADTIAFAEGGSEAMRIDSSGNVGIGVAATDSFSFSKALDIGSTGGAFVYVRDTDATNGIGGIGLSGTRMYVINKAAGPMTFHVNSDTNERMRIASGGQVMIGTTTEGDASADDLTVAGSGNTGITIRAGSSSSSSIYMSDATSGSGEYAGYIAYSHGSDAMNFATGSTQRMTIASTGLTDLFSSTTALRVRTGGSGTSTQALSAFHSATSTSNGTQSFVVYANGNVQNTNNSYGSISDQNLKENIVDATDKLSDIKQVKVRNFNFIGDSTKQIGVVAQELETIFPALVDTIKDSDADGNQLETETKSVKYSVFVPILIKSIQEQQTVIEALTARITALEG